MMLRARLLAGAALVASAILIAPDSSAQQTNGLYIVGGLGANWLRDADTTGTGVNTKYEFETGWAGIVGVGWGYGNGIRVELEGGYRTNDVDKASTGTANGDTNAWSLMLNGLYDVNTGTSFTPYIGAGLGLARVKFDDVTVPGGTTRIDDSDTTFAYQGLLGIAYTLAPQWKIDLGYRYFVAHDPEFNASTGAKVESEYRSHTVLLALRYEFGAPPPRPMAQPAAVTPPPPPAPAPAPAQAAPAPAPAPAPALQRSYLVFFDWDKADITAEARRIIQQAADNAKRGNVSRIQATGHADRSGPDRYNMALSIRRANNVKAELVRAGIPETQIAVIGRGETQPLVPTADGVREPQNRRVEILLQ
jgi:outer membrane protein OmpA-like peptidoglycan-associated protein